MMIALVMIKMSLISMSIFVESIGFAWTHQIGKNGYCKRHKHLETKLLQERIDVCAENLTFLGRTCGLYNESGHLAIRCKLFHDRIVSKNCDNLITLGHHKSLVFFWGMKK